MGFFVFDHDVGSMKLQILDTGLEAPAKHHISLNETGSYNFALFCAFLSMGSIFVAFITSPLTFSFPLMNSFCAFALPEMSFANSTSLRMSVTARNLSQ